MAKEILGLRGVTRAHLCSVGGDFDVYIETCHQASPSDERAFCINGSRYVVRDSREAEEYYFIFPNEVEEHIEAKVRARDMESAGAP